MGCKSCRKNESFMNKCIIAALVVICLAVAAVGWVLHFLLSPENSTSDREGVLVSCATRDNITKELCISKGCAWEVLGEKDAPSCYFPDGYGYTLMGEPVITAKGLNFYLTRTANSTLYPDHVEYVKLEVEYIGESSVRFKFSDNTTERFEVPDATLKIETPDTAVNYGERIYNVTWTTEPQFGIAVLRKDDGTIIFDTRFPGFVFADQFLQITTGLPSANVYGFGEHSHRRLLHDMNWKKWTIFTRDVAPVNAWNGYGAQPFYLNLEKDGKANGVFLKNSNAMDILLQPDPHPAITYRVIGGVLDFYVFLADTPDEVVQQYTAAVGRHLMPPYWSLGFQLGRWNYGNLSAVKEVVRRNRAVGIPQDVQFGDVDYMYKEMDFTYDRVNYDGLPEFIEELHESGQRYIVILDPFLGINETLLNYTMTNSPGFNAYQDGLDMGVFIRDPNGNVPLLAEGWSGLAVFPDFSNKSSQDWWTRWCDFLRVNESIEYDGLWMDMNEPSSFVQGSVNGCENNRWNYPPYVPNVLGAEPDGKLFDKTICMDAVQAMGIQYDLHNLYGHLMSIRTFRTLEDIYPDKRPFAITRSNFAGTQKYAMHWLGDYQSEWQQIPWTIVAMLEFNIFGFSMTGADICGFWYNTNEEMCTRWTQLGAFYPYSRNNNAKGFRDQDPAAFSDNMIRSSKHVLQTRYKLLPFLYTLMYHSHTMGSTVARPLFFEFPMDNKTYAIDKQFLWGSALMISPALEQAQRKVEVYFPEARWFDYFTGEEVEGVGKRHILDCPLNTINVHVRGGSVIPWQEPDNTTVFSRERPMGLLIALDQSQKALGSLFWDDGESNLSESDFLKLDFSVQSNQLNIQVEGSFAGANHLFFKTIDLFGLGLAPGRVTVDGKEVPPQHVNSRYGSGKGVQITNQRLNITEPHTIAWVLF